MPVEPLPPEPSAPVWPAGVAESIQSMLRHINNCLTMQTYADRIAKPYLESAQRTQDAMDAFIAKLPAPVIPCPPQ